jgi:eukaryotic-like serine/threonine-protein kinase
LYIQGHKYEEASKAVEKALQLNDRDYLVWGNLAIAYEGLQQGGKQSEARDHEIALLEQDVQATPRDAVKQAVLGLLYAQKKMRDKAIPHLESALALSADDPNVLESAGEAYEAMGDRASAIRYIQKSIQKGYSLASLGNIDALQKMMRDPNFHPEGK